MKRWLVTIERIYKIGLDADSEISAENQAQEIIERDYLLHPDEINVHAEEIDVVNL